MPTEIRVPALGESITEATVARWLKQEGEAVAVGEPVVELETEKVNTEVPADESGVLEKIASPEGTTVHPGDVLALIGEAKAEAPRPVAPAETRPTTEPTAAERQSTEVPVQERGDGAAQEEATTSGESADERVRASSVARRLAEELGVDLSRVPGSGPGGRISREDVEAYAQQQSAPPSARAERVEAPEPTPSVRPELIEGRAETRQRLSRRRLTIARRLVEAQRTAAMLTTFNEIDMSRVVALRQRVRDSFRERHGVGLGFMSFFTKAVVGALKEFPQVNAELQGEELVLKHYYDIGIAIGDPEGLVVPVLRDADKLTFAQVEARIAEFAQKARARRLSLDELRGGTFTITNGGVFGSLNSTPILNPPQVGILGMHRIQDRPVAVNDQVAIRPMMYVALSYDHRVVDGREAVLFLVRIKELVEDPERLLLES